MLKSTRLLLCILVAIISLTMVQTCSASNLSVPMHHGVVFFAPDSPDDAIRQLEAIKRDGFDLIEYASWTWKRPSPGSKFENTANSVLDWCDRNGMAFFLMYNIQYGDQKQGGGLNDQVIDPSKTLPLVADWARTLRNHPSVIGVLLGNEVGPTLGTPSDAPALWQLYRQYLKRAHGSIAGLNTAWRTNYSSFDEIGIPSGNGPAMIDYRRYSNRVFGSFYGYLFDRGFRPVLGEKLYGTKTSTDPFLHRACTDLSIASWDDLTSLFPLWYIKCLADTTTKPVFNSELHLYHDAYNYSPSPEHSRYRYFTSATLGEYMTASFAWGSWNKPTIQRVHSATPGILSDLRKQEPYLRAIAKSSANADMAVLVTEGNYYTGSIDNLDSAPLARLYAHMGSLGRPWRYVLESDIASLQSGTVVIWTSGMRLSTARALASLPSSVQLVAINRVPITDEYGIRLPSDILGRIISRTRITQAANLANTLGYRKGLPSQYRITGKIDYPWWSRTHGSFRISVPYCLLEAHFAPYSNGLLVTIVNNSGNDQNAPFPTAYDGKTVTDLRTGRKVISRGLRTMHFPPFAVNSYIVK